jgi:hypothetical protein
MHDDHPLVRTLPASSSKPSAHTVLLCLASLILVLFAGCLGGASTGEPAASETECADGMPFSPPDDAFTFCAANGWTLEEELWGAVVVLFRDDGHDEDILSNVNIYTQPILEGETMETARQDLLEHLPQIITDYELVRENPTELGGEDAHEFIFHGRQGFYFLTFHQVLTIHEDTAYAWTHTVKRASEDLGDPEVAKMRDTLRFH